MPFRNYANNIPLQMTSGHPLPTSQLHRDHHQSGLQHPSSNQPARGSFGHQIYRPEQERVFTGFEKSGDGRVGLSGLPSENGVFVATGLSGLPVKIDLANHMSTGLSGLPEEFTANLIPTGVPPIRDAALDRFDFAELRDALPSGEEGGRVQPPQLPEQSPTGHFGPLSSHPVKLGTDQGRSASYEVSGMESGKWWDTQAFRQDAALNAPGPRQHHGIEPYLFGSSRRAPQQGTFVQHAQEVKYFHGVQQPRQDVPRRLKQDPVVHNRVPRRVSSANQQPADPRRRKPVETPVSEWSEIPNALYERVEWWLDRVKPPKEPEDSDRWMMRLRDETQVLWSEEANRNQRPDFPIFEESSHHGTKRSANEAGVEGHAPKRAKIYDTIRSKFSHVGSQTTWTTSTGRGGREGNESRDAGTPDEKSGPVKRVISRLSSRRMSSRLSWNALSVRWDDSNYSPKSRAQLRVGLLGNMSCGKSSIVRRILDPNFEDWENISQTGYADSEWVTFAAKDHGKESVRVEMYDVPGKYWEQNGNIFLIPEIFDAVVLCFGLDDVRNVERVLDEWATRIRESKLKVPVYLLGTKRDMRPEHPQLELTFLPRRKTVTQLEGMQAAQTIGARKYLETCVLDFTETHGIMREIVMDVVRERKRELDKNSHRRLSQAFCLP